MTFRNLVLPIPKFYCKGFCKDIKDISNNNDDEDNDNNDEKNNTVPNQT